MQALGSNAVVAVFAVRTVRALMIPYKAVSAAIANNAMIGAVGIFSAGAVEVRAAFVAIQAFAAFVTPCVSVSVTVNTHSVTAFRAFGAAFRIEMGIAVNTV